MRKILQEIEKDSQMKSQLPKINFYLSKLNFHEIEIIY